MYGILGNLDLILNAGVRILFEERRWIFWKLWILIGIYSYYEIYKSYYNGKIICLYVMFNSNFKILFCISKGLGIGEIVW